MKGLAINLPGIVKEYLERKRVPEDHYLMVGDIFVVADGVTRPVDEKTGFYSQDSLAKLAAKTLGESFVEYVQGSLPKTSCKEELVAQAFSFANKKIKELNEEQGITEETVDYYHRDFAACVAAAGFIWEGVFYFGQITDSGVVIFDEENGKMVDFAKSMLGTRLYLEKMREKGEFKNGKEERIFVRSKVVNNPNFLQFGGLRVDFGVLTGQGEALSYLDVGSVKLRPGLMVVLYTDGFVNFLLDEEFVRLLRQIAPDETSKVEDYVKEKFLKKGDAYGREKTLIRLKV